MSIEAQIEELRAELKASIDRREIRLMEAELAVLLETQGRQFEPAE